MDEEEVEDAEDEVDVVAPTEKEPEVAKISD